jgi:hypothetical protein
MLSAGSESTPWVRAGTGLGRAALLPAAMCGPVRACWTCSRLLARELRGGQVRSLSASTRGAARPAVATCEWWSTPWGQRAVVLGSSTPTGVHVWRACCAMRRREGAHASWMQRLIFGCARLTSALAFTAHHAPDCILTANAPSRPCPHTIHATAAAAPPPSPHLPPPACTPPCGASSAPWRRRHRSTCKQVRVRVDPWRSLRCCSTKMGMQQQAKQAVARDPTACGRSLTPCDLQTNETEAPQARPQPPSPVR